MKATDTTIPLFDRHLSPSFEATFSPLSEIKPVKSSIKTITAELRSMNSAQSANRLHTILGINGQALAQTLGKAVMVQSFIKGQIKSSTSTGVSSLSPQAMHKIEKDYAPTGCQYRTWAINNRLESLGATPLSLLIKSDQPLSASRGGFKNVEWQYHISSALIGDDNQLYILDPSINNTKPVLIQEWAQSIKFNGPITLQLAPQNAFPGQQSKYIYLVDNDAEKELTTYQNRMDKLHKNSNAANPQPISPDYDWAYPLSTESSQTYSFSKSLANQVYHEMLQFKQDDLTAVNRQKEVKPLFVDGNNRSLSKAEVENKMKSMGVNHIQINSLPMPV
ncbi:MAG TPA: hypothetical protein DHW71_12210 [Gammaproteobacteria bacterium]|nr:hypothetical protein [Gammaproteobacteria bacterium]HBF09616.1 hypothetical protein [Gammaproteobacteria bacterium]HCK93751.1 hypothetical protein [Gammaproteobacteria bacterium]|tara:strand:- start:2046 stop:3050 length:1005 start_codon:yes stop_codon:yes gene_type:complete